MAFFYLKLTLLRNTAFKHCASILQSCPFWCLQDPGVSSSQWHITQQMALLQTLLLSILGSKRIQMIRSAVYFLGGISNTDSFSQSEAPRVSSNSSSQSEFTLHKKQILYSLSSHCKSKVVVSTKDTLLGYIFTDDVHMSITWIQTLNK